MICIFCFYNVSTGIQAKLSLSKTFKHCNIITFDGEVWLATEFDAQGIHNRPIKAYSGKSLIRGLKYINSLIGMVVIDVNERAKHYWKPYIVRSCNELDRYISGVNTGFTFNPKQLYNKLLKNKDSNYDILYHWRR